jgi:tyrosyl-tRNA synthetase
MPFLPVEEQLRQLRRGVAEVLPEDALAEKLERSAREKRPLTVKLGCDPSRPDLHLGHAVVLRKLRQFQDLGHRAVLIVGDFTAMIGDPSGKSKTRPALTFEETRANGQTYFDQAAHLLDPAPEKLQIRYNSEWLGKMAFADVIRLASRYTVARMLERDEFEQRYEAGEPIAVHEFLYPLAQAQDSVELAADVELGGTDQRFNLLVGRSIQEASGQAPQVCVLMPILEGTDGVQKMSKSLDNYIGIAEPSEEMYGKTLSIPDRLIYRYVELATDIPLARLEHWRRYAEENPRDAKHDLAFTLVRMYHGNAAAQQARAHFERTVVQKEVPEDLPEVAPEAEGGKVGLLDLIRQAGFAASNGEARRLVQQGGVTIDGTKVDDPMRVLDLAAEAPFVLKVGKRRYARIVGPS